MATTPAPAPAADEGASSKASPRKSIVKIILGVVGVIALLAGTVIGTLYFSGHFHPKPSVEPDAAEADGHGAEGSSKKGTRSSKASKNSEPGRLEYRYLQIEKDFLVNVMNSKKVMLISLAVMTHDDGRVLENVKKHDFALRSTVLDILRQVPESDINKSEFRVELARNIRDAMNKLLEKYEDFGGIEEVLYTNFIIQ